MEKNVRTFRQRKRIIFFWMSAPLLASLLLFTEPVWFDGDVRNEIVRQLGAFALLTCIAGRCWAALHIGGQKNQQLVTSGPYARTRNPLYFFSTMGLAGIGLAVGSVTLGGVFFCFGYLAFSYVIRREEWALERFFDSEYHEYTRLVPRFFPSFSAIVVNQPCDNQKLYNPHALAITFCHALVFLLPIPLYELIKYMQDGGLIVPLLKLY
jgi:protein-S-isoprenylcysteine O-methyltransferase Ste14